ncbi:MAG: chloride channel protein [Gammaproteobacteria bacterium]
MRRLLSLRSWKTRGVFWLGAVAVGLAATAFAHACDIAIGFHAGLVQRWPIAAPLIAPAGILVVAWLTRRYLPEAGGSGIPQAIAALAIQDPVLRRRILSIRIAVAKMVLTVAGLMSGASIGREGPTVHIGAAILASIGRLGRFPSEYLRRGLVLAGAAAGLAAAFNTPIAGIVFVVEELARSFEERTTGTVITAVVIAGAVSTGLLGNYAYFGVSTAHIHDVKSCLAIPVCAVIGGLAGGLFSRALLGLERRLAPARRANPVKAVLVPVLLIALIGAVSGGTSFGTGYEQARMLVAGEAGPGPLFPLLKWLATLASYLTGIPGGIFSPSLAIGSGIGSNLAPLLPYVSVATMAVLGMVGYFSGVTQAPLTGAVVVMEMVDDHALVLPLLATAFLAMGVSRLICPVPLYKALANAFLDGTATRNAA